MRRTVLHELMRCLDEAGQFTPGAQVAPVAILWPDELREWGPAIARLREARPVVTLGEADPESSTGPAYWIRCVVAGTVSTDLPDGIPIIYMPGVGRASLRAIDSCPRELAPIAELQYRGQWFTHANGRDWTIAALLRNEQKGLALRVVDTADTRDALLVSLGLLLDQPMERLSQQEITAALIHELANPDPIRRLLGWLDAPDEAHAGMDEGQWKAFVHACSNDYGFSPDGDGVLTAGRMLGERKGRWDRAWTRFAEMPASLPGIQDLLGRARPDELIIEQPASWPTETDAAEGLLRNALMDLLVLTPDGARKELQRLEGEHAPRRGWVWAALGRAPLTFAVEHLSALAETTSRPWLESDLGAFVDDYVALGWRADDAAAEALAAAPMGRDRDAVAAALQSAYRPWVDAGARVLQALVAPLADAGTYDATGASPAVAGTVTLFVDGLRMDIGRRVAEALADGQSKVDLSEGRAALPTVTPTAKAAVTPVAAGALMAGPELFAARASNGTKASVEVLRSLMAEAGVQVLAAGEAGDPSGPAWTEGPSIDHIGHDAGINMVDRLDGEVARIVDRVRQLLGEGWSQVDIVTDHGWLLIPGGMEKVDLPVATTEAKKGRCARLKAGALVEVPTVPWFWDRDVRIAVAPGITCFEAGKSYEHGGVSPQECIVPRLSVAAAWVPEESVVEIRGIKWLGLQCRIELAEVTSSVTLDIRGLPAEPTSSIAETVKETSSGGRLSLIVPDEDHQGEKAFLVVLSADGALIAQREVTVGQNR